MSWVATTAAGSSSKASSGACRPTSASRRSTWSATRPRSKPLWPAGGLRDHRVQVVHASEVLTMEDKPAGGLRKKKDCSIVRAVELVQEGKADAVISPGNTGGMFAAATLQAAAASRAWNGAASPPSSRAATTNSCCWMPGPTSSASPITCSIRHHGQRLFPGDPGLREPAGGHPEHRHRGYQGQRADAWKPSSCASSWTSISSATSKATICSTTAWMWWSATGLWGTLC